MAALQGVGLRSPPAGSKPPSGKTACSLHTGKAFCHSQVSTYTAPEAAAALLLPWLHIIQNFPNWKILTSDHSPLASPLASDFSLRMQQRLACFSPSFIHPRCTSHHLQGPPFYGSA